MEIRLYRPETLTWMEDAVGRVFGSFQNSGCAPEYQKEITPGFQAPPPDSGCGGKAEEFRACIRRNIASSHHRLRLSFSRYIILIVYSRQSPIIAISIEVNENGDTAARSGIEIKRRTQVAKDG